MRRTSLWVVLLVIGLAGLTNCSASNTQVVTPPPPAIVVTFSQAPPTTIAVNTTATVSANVANDTAGVNWSCTPVGSCGTFSVMQTASGATTTYTAPAAPATVMIIATSQTDTSKSASASVNVTQTFAFYLSGLETGENYYAVAGTVVIGGGGTVVTGEEDYNDANGITTVQPNADQIMSGTLTVDSTTEQGTLTLVSSNTAVGVLGTQTLGVQFVNTNHALIVEFDGFATSSGSMDYQTIPATLSGSFAFALSGVQAGFQDGRRTITNSAVSGGVFTTDGVNVTNGVMDIDNGGTLTPQTLFTGTMTGPDTLGRGTLTFSNMTDSFNYYVVGPEAIRIIDVDTSDSAVGSAFGQGASAGGFSNNSLVQAVFGVQSNALGFNYAAAGMFTTNSTASTFSGVADTDEEGVVETASAISGTYFVTTVGYGNLTITNGGAEDVSVLGIYMTDPLLNLSDPNNTTSGLGGALVADLDTTLTGTGLAIPQSDIVVADFAGDYAFGGQVFDAGGVPLTGWEVDFVGQGTFTNGVLAGTATISDPFLTLSTSGDVSGAAVTGTAVPDGVNPGRYTMSGAGEFGVAIGGTVTQVPVAIYQASGEQLLFLDEGDFSMSLGSFQQQPQAGADVVKKTAAQNKPKPKH
jgi:hypothetical protein